MPLMTLSQVRVQDPIMTAVIQGYNRPELIGNFALPPVQVATRSGKIIEFGKTDFARYDTLRAPGGPTRRRPLAEYTGRQYNLLQDSIEGELPMEFIEEAQANNVPFDLQTEAAEGAKYSIDLNLEYRQARLITDPTQYGTNTIVLSGSDQWLDPASDPIAQVFEMKEMVRRQVGVYPNSAIIGPTVLAALANHPAIRDQLKYTSGDPITAEILAAKIFGFTRGMKVGGSLTLDPDTDELVDIWGDIIWMGYVPPTITNRRQPSFGYTYTLKGYPIAEEPYYDRNHKCWYYPVTNESQPLLTGLVAGFLARNVAGGFTSPMITRSPQPVS